MNTLRLVCFHALVLLFIGSVYAEKKCEFDDPLLCECPGRACSARDQVPEIKNSKPKVDKDRPAAKMQDYKAPQKF